MTARKTIQDMRILAGEKSGKCLSENYINNHTRLKWECKNGHQWDMSPHSISLGFWCPYCSRKRKLTLEYFQELAEKKGGRCLSNHYTTQKNKMLWECQKGHQWEAKGEHVKNGNWCLLCFREKYKRLIKKSYSIDDMKKLARSKGGECLSTRYLSS